MVSGLNIKFLFHHLLFVCVWWQRAQAHYKLQLNYEIVRFMDIFGSYLMVTGDVNEPFHVDAFP